jgi:hypothetical protein
MVLVLKSCWLKLLVVAEMGQEYTPVPFSLGDELLDSPPGTAMSPKP